jgi:peptidoglycan/LPS O-acetylase OafA/YrhL
MPGEPFKWLTGRGNLGVDFFFVLSGFIILFAHSKDIDDPGAWPRYATKRFMRIYPLYWLATAILLAFSAWGLGSKHLPATPAEWLTVFTLVRFTDFPTPLAPAWTLFHEIAFYALFSMLILSRRVGIAVFVAWTAIILTVFFYPDHDHPTTLGTLFSAYGLNFLFGMGACMAYPRISKPVAALCVAAGAATFCATLFGDSDYLRPICALSLAALITGAVRLETGRLELSVLTFLGNASFSIYLFHESIEARLLHLAARVVMPEWLSYILILTLSVGLGCVVHWVIERPLLSISRQLSRQKPSITTTYTTR